MRPPARGRACVGRGAVGGGVAGAVATGRRGCLRAARNQGQGGQGGQGYEPQRVVLCGHGGGRLARRSTARTGVRCAWGGSNVRAACAVCCCGSIVVEFHVHVRVYRYLCLSQQSIVRQSLIKRCSFIYPYLIEAPTAWIQSVGSVPLRATNANEGMRELHRRASANELARDRSRCALHTTNRRPPTKPTVTQRPPPTSHPGAAHPPPTHPVSGKSTHAHTGSQRAHYSALPAQAQLLWRASHVLPPSLPARESRMPHTARRERRTHGAHRHAVPIPPKRAPNLSEQCFNDARGPTLPWSRTCTERWASSPWPPWR